MHTPSFLSPSPQRPQKTEAWWRTYVCWFWGGVVSGWAPHDLCQRPRQWPGQRSAFARCPARLLSTGRTTVFGERGIHLDTQMLWVLVPFSVWPWLIVQPPPGTNPGLELIQHCSVCDLCLRPGPFQPKSRSGMKLQDVLYNFPPGVTLSTRWAHSAPAPPAGGRGLMATLLVHNQSPCLGPHPPLPHLPKSQSLTRLVLFVLWDLSDHWCNILQGLKIGK